MEMNEQYKEGLLAGLAGWESFDCPYPEYKMYERDNWKAGWAQGNLYFTALKRVAQA